MQDFLLVRFEIILKISRYNADFALSVYIDTGNDWSTRKGY